MTANAPAPLVEDVAEHSYRLGRWPFGLLVVAIIRLVAAISIGARAFGFDGPLAGVPLVASQTVVTQGINLTGAALTIIGVIGLLTFRRWGWVLTMVIVGVELAANLIRVYIGQPDHMAMLLLVICAFYLNQSSVRALASAHLDPPARGS